MKSNLCKIGKGAANLAPILQESEKVAVYNQLNHKQTLHLRLLCEELDGLLPELLGEFEGDFWIEFQDDTCKLVASLQAKDLNAQQKDQLLQMTKNKKNAATRTLSGKIRNALEMFLINTQHANVYSETIHGYDANLLVSTGSGYTHAWSLSQYKADSQRDEPWDELEKSVVAALADDVIIGMIGNRVELIIVKNFAKE